MSSGSLRQVPLTCPGHTRPVVHVHFSDVDKDGKSKFISASKGNFVFNITRLVIISKSAL
jgi:hypothetical protein